MKSLEEIVHPNHTMVFIVRHLAAKFYGNEDDGGIKDGISIEKLQRKSGKSSHVFIPRNLKNN